MKVTYEDKHLRELVETGYSRRYKKFARDKSFMKSLKRVIDVMEAVERCSELSLYSFLHYEKLRYIELSSVRIVNGRVERLLFREVNDGIEVVIIDLDDTHYGNKK